MAEPPNNDALRQMPPIGLIGLGHMGAALAERLLATGLTLLVHDVSPAAMNRLASPRCLPTSDVTQFARQCAIVVFCLPTPEASRAVSLAMDTGATLRLVIETSTVGPHSMRELEALLAQRGVELLDAPVSGGPSGARAGTLSVMYAGTQQAVRAGLLVIDAIADRRFLVGDRPGLAQVCKLVNNAISAAGMVAACEAAVLGVRAGLDAGSMVAAINAGSGRNAATLDKFPRAILPGTFDFGGPLGLMLKDLGLFNDLATEYGVHNTMAPATLAAWREAVAHSGPQADYSELIRRLEGDAGVTVRTAAGDNQTKEGALT